MKWRTIETAPRDVDILLAEISPDGPSCEFGEIDIGRWGQWTESDVWGNPIPCHGWLSNYGRVENPTHWIHIPAFPT